MKRVKRYSHYRRIDLVALKPYLISRFCTVKNNNGQQPYSFIYYYNYYCYIDPGVFLRRRLPPYGHLLCGHGRPHRMFTPIDVYVLKFTSANTIQVLVSRTHIDMFTFAIILFLYSIIVVCAIYPILQVLKLMRTTRALFI